MSSSRYNNGLAAVSLPTNSWAPVTVSEELGPVAQSVEQRTENPCVGGSIPPRATKSEFQEVQERLESRFSHRESGFFHSYAVRMNPLTSGGKWG